MIETIKLTGAISPREIGYNEGYEDGRRNAGNMKWIPIDERLPEVNVRGVSEYLLLSFDNFDLPDIGRYEIDEEGSGKFYLGDSDESFFSLGLFVNAWMPLMKCYKEDT